MICDTCHKVLKFIKETKKWLCPCCGLSVASPHFWARKVKNETKS